MSALKPTVKELLVFNNAQGIRQEEQYERIIDALKRIEERLKPQGNPLPMPVKVQ